MLKPIATLTLIAALTASLASAQSQYINPARSQAPGDWRNPAGSSVEDLEGIGITQKLDAQVDLGLEFTDSSGQTVRFGDMFQDGKPVVLSFVYYDCPMLCTLELNGLLKAMRAMEKSAGDAYRVVTVSFDPRDTVEAAAEKKETYVKQYTHTGFFDREKTEEAWSFLVGSEENVRALADSVGFGYRYDEARDLYRHASGIMTLTPEGRVSRYQMGVEYSARDLKFALMEASDMKIGSPVDAVMLYCFHYDPATGKYGFVVMNALQVAGGLTLLVLGGFIGLSLLRERRRARESVPGPAAS